jgi:WD40 repeat protein
MAGADRGVPHGNSVDAAESVLKMRIGALMSLDDSFWAQYSKQVESASLDSEITAPGRLLALAPLWLSARRKILESKVLRNEGASSDELSVPLSLLHRLGLTPTRSSRRGKEWGIPDLEAAARSSTGGGSRGPKPEASDKGGSAATGAVKARGLAARGKKKEASDKDDASKWDSEHAPFVPLLQSLPPSAMHEGEPSYVAWRKALLAKKALRMKQWVDDTSMQRLAAEAMRRALEAEKKELGKWVDSDEEESSGEESDDGATTSIPGTRPGQSSTRQRTGSVTSGTGSARPRQRLRGKALRMGVSHELKEWAPSVRISADLMSLEDRDKRSRDGDVGAIEVLHLPPPPSALPASSMQEGRGHGGDDFGAATDDVGDVLASAKAGGIPFPQFRMGSCTAIAIGLGKSTRADQLIPPHRSTAAEAASSWKAPAYPSPADLVAYSCDADHTRSTPSGLPPQPHTAIIDAITGQEFAQLDGHTAAVAAISWDPTGSYVLTAGLDGQVRIWTVEAPRYEWNMTSLNKASSLLREFREGPDTPADKALRRKPSAARVTSSLNNEKLRSLLRPVSRGGSAGCVRLVVRDTPITHAAFFPSSSNLCVIARSVPRKSSILKTAAAVAVTSLTVGMASVKSGSAWTGCLEVLNVSTGHSVQHFEVPDAVTALEFAYNGTILYWADIRGRIRCVDVSLSSMGSSAGPRGGGPGLATAALSTATSLFTRSPQMTAATLASGDATSRQAGGDVLVESSMRVIFDQSVASLGANNKSVAETAAAWATTLATKNPIARVIDGVRRNASSRSGETDGSRPRGSSESESTGRPSRGESGSHPAWGGQTAGLTYANDDTESLHSHHTAGAGDTQSVTSWEPGSSRGAELTPGVPHSSAKTVYVIKMEYRPYDTLLRCPALTTLDSTGARRTFALVANEMIDDVVARCKEESITVLALGGSCLHSPAAMKLWSDGMGVSLTDSEAVSITEAIEGSSEMPSKPSLKPWQIGRRRDLGRAGTNSPSRLGRLFGRGGPKHHTPAGITTISGTVEIAGSRAKRAFKEPVLSGPFSSVAESGTGSDCILVGTSNGDVAILDPYAKSVSGAVVARLKAHARPVTAVVWSSDDSRLITADEGGTVTVWDHPILATNE